MLLIATVRAEECMEPPPPLPRGRRGTWPETPGKRTDFIKPLTPACQFGASQNIHAGVFFFFFASSTAEAHNCSYLLALQTGIGCQVIQVLVQSSGDASCVLDIR